MHLLKFDLEAKTLTEIPLGEFAAEPACRYFYVQGKHASVPVSTPDGIGEIVWQHPDYQPPSPSNAMTDDYRENWDMTSEEGSLCFASAIYSRLVGGEQVGTIVQWLAKYLRTNAAPHRINAMTDQHYHRATDEQWARHQRYKSDLDSSCILELRHRVEALETHIAAIEPLAARTQAATGSALQLALLTSKLGHRIEALEATQHAHIEATAAEAGARCAVEQMRGKPGSWQPLRAFNADEVAPIVVPTAEPAADAWQLMLVERVALAINPKPDENPIFLYKDEARAAIRVVAEWLRRGDAGAGCSWSMVANLLDNEANH